MYLVFFMCVCYTVQIHNSLLRVPQITLWHDECPIAVSTIAELLDKDITAQHIKTFVGPISQCFTSWRSYNLHSFNYCDFVFFMDSDCHTICAVACTLLEVVIIMGFQVVIKNSSVCRVVVGDSYFRVDEIPTFSFRMFQWATRDDTRKPKKTSRTIRSEARQVSYF